MEYLEGVEQLREIRRATIGDLANGVSELGDSFLSAEERVLSLIGEFHQSQRGYRVSEWCQFDWSMPKPYSSSISLHGPYLSYCRREGRRVRKTRVSQEKGIQEVVNSQLQNAISEYRQAGIRLNALADVLDLKCGLDREGLAKSKVVHAYRAETKERLAQMPVTVRSLSDALDKLDEVLDEALLDFNAIEGKRRRYGSFLARWEVPSRLPGKTFSGPSGPGVFYVAFNRGKRMSAPIRNLYMRVHQRTPKAETPLTKQMIQKSRLGKFTSEYRSAYKQLMLLRSERDSVIERIKAVQKRLK